MYSINTINGSVEHEKHEICLYYARDLLENDEDNCLGF